MTEFIAWISPFLDRHGWPTTVLLVVCVGIVIAFRWAAPKLDSWVSTIVLKHCALIDSLTTAIDAIKESLLKGTAQYTSDVARSDQTLSRIETKIDGLKEDVSEIRHG